MPRLTESLRTRHGFCTKAVDHSKTVVSYTDFVNKDGASPLLKPSRILVVSCLLEELVAFSRYDVMRSIPCFVDGMKPGQRKILYAAFKRNLRHLEPSAMRSLPNWDTR